MDLFKFIDADFNISDNRGELYQLVHDGYKQVNVLYSLKGVTRGGHFHKESSELFFVVSGSVQVHLKKGNEEGYRVFYKGDFFKIFPEVVHSMTFLEDCILVALYDVPVEKMDGTMDIISWEI